MTIVLLNGNCSTAFAHCYLLPSVKVYTTVILSFLNATLSDFSFRDNDGVPEYSMDNGTTWNELGGGNMIGTTILQGTVGDSSSATYGTPLTSPQIISNSYLSLNTSTGEITVLKDFTGVLMIDVQISNTGAVGCYLKRGSSYNSVPVTFSTGGRNYLSISNALEFKAGDTFAIYCKGTYGSSAQTIYAVLVI